LFPRLTVQENMELGPKLEGIANAERQQIAEKHLDPAGLAPHVVYAGVVTSSNYLQTSPSPYPEGGSASAKTSDRHDQRGMRQNGADHY
jgi:hypothetical protein